MVLPARRGEGPLGACPGHCPELTPLPGAPICLSRHSPATAHLHHRHGVGCANMGLAHWAEGAVPKPHVLPGLWPTHRRGASMASQVLVGPGHPTSPTAGSESASHDAMPCCPQEPPSPCREPGLRAVGLPQKPCSPCGSPPSRALKHHPPAPSRGLPRDSVDHPTGGSRMV